MELRWRTVVFQSEIGRRGESMRFGRYQMGFCIEKWSFIRLVMRSQALRATLHRPGIWN
ncbi:hypothetical protein VDG1235_1014 [Verrucomicrobiia bacterium DG1235]|nr:hypothetical protein VDG1235_1014 [Verrucomicrobiae bacterium DG1235]